VGVEYSVELDMDIELPEQEAAIDAIDRVLTELEPFGAGAAFDAHSFSVRLTVEAASVEAAVRPASMHAMKAVVNQGLVHEIPKIKRVEIESIDDLARRLALPDTPQLVGVAEVAQLLRVSRQRVSELARARNFPKPIAHLKSGPIWRRTQITAHLGRGPSKPGRPRRKGGWEIVDSSGRSHGVFPSQAEAIAAVKGALKVASTTVRRLSGSR
jgi:predicted DNA-binding transcriptional regulator AlpA